jgi:hypothetical protein
MIDLVFGAGAPGVGLFLNIPRIVQNGGGQSGNDLPFAKGIVGQRGAVDQAGHGKQGIRGVPKIVVPRVAGAVTGKIPVVKALRGIKDIEMPFEFAVMSIKFGICSDEVLKPLLEKMIALFLLYIR